MMKRTGDTDDNRRAKLRWARRGGVSVDGVWEPVDQLVADTIKPGLRGAARPSCSWTFLSFNSLGLTYVAGSRDGAAVSAQLPPYYLGLRTWPGRTGGE